MSLVRPIRVVLLLGYLAVTAAAFAWPPTPRVFWTMIMPAVPLGFVLAGFHAWRRTCPIATIGAVGARLHRGGNLPAGWRRRSVSIAFAALIATLAGRHVATNGDSVALGVFLVALAVAAVVVNAWGGGRSFCHHLCPVGIVERIYTDDAPQPAQASSRCARCTGCAPACADVDRDKSFRRARLEGARRRASYAFPGLVLAFYAYYALREGSWEAYFDGRWTRDPFTLERALGPGLVAAPEVPALVAAPLVLLGFAAISYLLFAALERALTRRWTDAATRRARMLALSGFVAFNLFYLFAGAPSLRLVPGLARVLELVVPTVATLALVHRLRRAEDGRDRPASSAPVAPARTRRTLPLWKEAG